MNYKQSLAIFVKTLNRWGLNNQDFILSGRLSMFICGEYHSRKYYSNKKEPSKDMVFLLPKNKVPWRINNHEYFETIPPAGSKFFKDYSSFIKKTGFEVHFYFESAKKFKEIFKKSIPHCLGETTISVTSPLEYLNFMSKTLNDCHKNKIGKEWGFRMLTFYLPEVARVAKKRNNKEVLQKCQQILKRYNYLLKQIKTTKTLGSTTLKGVSVSRGYIKGLISVFLEDDFHKIKKSTIVVTKSVSPLIVPHLKRVKAIVTDEGGTFSHAAIMAREFGIPCVVGTKIATRILRNGDIVEVDANKGIVTKLN